VEARWESMSTAELFQDVPGVEDVKVEDCTEGDYQFRGVSGMMPTLSISGLERMI
jgi:hypothetical protein